MSSKIETNVLEIRRKNQVEYLTFPSFDQTGIVRHLFSTRKGGVSQGQFASMNLSYTRGDEAENVTKNFERIAQTLGCQLSDFVLSDQTHEDRVRLVMREDAGKGITKTRDFFETDGMITNQPGIVLATFYADCVPLFFLDPVNKAIGLTHAGWRGTVRKIASKTITAMQKEFGSDPAEILVGIGPSICSNCYEVGEDVASEFQSIFHNEEELCQVLSKQDQGKYKLNLWEANRLILQSVGVPLKHITTTDLCTACNHEILFSHRASGGKRGNLGAFLGINPEE